MESRNQPHRLYDLEELRWRPSTRSDRIVFEPRLGRILAEWDGTRYMAGSAAKRGGVDCVRFVCSVLDELQPAVRADLETLPEDAALHDRDAAIRGMRRIRSRYNAQVVRGVDVEPGDVLASGPADGGPGHALIVGPHRTLWHSTSGTGVARMGWSFANHIHKVFRVYRLNEVGT